MKKSKYNTADDLRQAIDHRLRKTAATEGLDVVRLRRQLAFERFLARLFSDPDCPLVLKGGYAMELRLRNSRATKDIDLALSDEWIHAMGSSELLMTIQDLLAEAVAKDLGDFFSFEIREKLTELWSPPRGGLRSYIVAYMGDKVFARFQLDIGAGNPRILPLIELSSRNQLAFAGISCPLFPSIPSEQHFAEKVHAYTTLHKGQMGSRVKDLIDMVLLIQNEPMSKAKLLDALHLTFAKNKKHPLPQELPAPPATWTTKFAALTKECHLNLTVDEAYVMVRDYYAKIYL